MILMGETSQTPNLRSGKDQGKKERMMQQITGAKVHSARNTVQGEIQWHRIWELVQEQNKLELERKS
jgi:hypothetical protein